MLLAWPLVRGMCLNHEVVMFQPRTVNPLYPGYVVNCYVDTQFLLTCSALLQPPPNLRLGGGARPPLATLSYNSVMQPHMIIHPPGSHLSLSQHTNTHHSLPHLLIILCPCLLLRSRHA